MSHRDEVRYSQFNPALYPRVIELAIDLAVTGAGCDHHHVFGGFVSGQGEGASLEGMTTTVQADITLTKQTALKHLCLEIRQMAYCKVNAPGGEFITQVAGQVADGADGGPRRDLAEVRD